MYQRSKSKSLAPPNPINAVNIPPKCIISNHVTKTIDSTSTVKLEVQKCAAKTCTGENHLVVSNLFPPT